MFYPQRKCPVCQHDNFAVALIHKSNYEQMVVRRISRKQGSVFFELCRFLHAIWTQYGRALYGYRLIWLHATAEFFKTNNLSNLSREGERDTASSTVIKTHSVVNTLARVKSLQNRILNRYSCFHTRPPFEKCSAILACFKLSSKKFFMFLKLMAEQFYDTKTQLNIEITFVL